MSTKTLPRQRTRCRTSRCAGACWPISASSDAGVVELSTRGLPAVLPRHLLAPVPAGDESLCVESFSEAQPHMEIWSFTVRRLSGVIPVYLTAFVLLSRLRP